LRADEERSVLQRILPVLSLGLLVVAALGIVMLFVDQVRKRRFLWGDGLKWGVLAAALAAILAAQRWDSVIMMNYESSMPYQLFLVGVAILIFAILVLAGLTAAVLVGTAFGVRPQARALLRGGHDRRWVRDGILFGLLAVVLLVGADRLHVVLTAFGARYLQIGELFDLPAVARPMPWLDVFADQLLRGILWLPALALAVHMVTRYIGEKRALGLLGIALVLFAAEGARSLPEFGFDLLRGAAVAGLGVFVLSRLLRGNDLAYLVALLVGRGVVAVAPWFSQPAPGAVLTGAIVAVLLAATVALLVALAARRAYGGASMGTSHQASIEPLNPSLTPYDQASHPS
jgi:hypothetical protein